MRRNCILGALLTLLEWRTIAKMFDACIGNQFNFSFSFLGKAFRQKVINLMSHSPYLCLHWFMLILMLWLWFVRLHLVSAFWLPSPSLTFSMYYLLNKWNTLTIHSEGWAKRVDSILLWQSLDLKTNILLCQSLILKTNIL